MINLLEKSVEEMPGISFDCDCGRKHSVAIEKIIIRNDILPTLGDELEFCRNGKILVTADPITYEVLAGNVVKQLKEEGFHIKEHIFNKGSSDSPLCASAPPPQLIPDEQSIEELLSQIDGDTAFILAVGSGTLNDITRKVSYESGIPYAIITTAPSMDGYASSTSSLIIKGKKTTCPGVYPTIIFSDVSIMKNAPIEMIRAGYGDIIGKLTAKADWDLAAIMDNEYYCETISNLVQKGVANCSALAEAIVKRNDRAISKLTEALIMTGVSIGLTGFSRPASGAEHLLSHYWEMDAIIGGRAHPLHGNGVGAGTVAIAMLYEITDRLLPGLLPETIKYPSSESVRTLLKRAGSSANPKELGIGRELFEKSILCAMRPEGKYTILNLLDHEGKLSMCADLLTKKFYDE